MAQMECSNNKCYVDMAQMECSNNKCYDSIYRYYIDLYEQNLYSLQYH